MLARKPDFTIYQGATPCLELGLPLELSSSDVVYATFAQIGNVVLEYQINGSNAQGLTPPTGSMEVDAHDKSLLRVSMSQADTLRLEAGEVELQIRIKHTEDTVEMADTLIPAHGWIGKALKGGSI